MDIRLAKPKFNLAPGKEQIIPLYGCDHFNQFLVSLLSGTAYVFLGGNSNDAPDFIFNPTGSPQSWKFVPIEARQITVVCSSTSVANLVGTLSVEHFECENCKRAGLSARNRV